MKITQNILDRAFFVEYGGNEYFVDYTNSDRHCLGLLNRDYWMVYFDNEEVEDDELKFKLIEFCRKNFDNYKPKLKVI